MTGDLPDRAAVARDTLTRTFRELYGVDEVQGGLLTVSVLVALTLREQAGGAPVTVQGGGYAVGDEPVLPHVQALAALKGPYLARFARDPRAAHALIQEALLERLGPSRSARASWA